MSVAHEAATVVSPKRGSLRWSSSPDYVATTSGQRLITPWLSCISQPPPPLEARVPTAPSFPLGCRSLPTSAQSIARCGFALMTLLLAFAETAANGRMFDAANSFARRGGPPFSRSSRASTLTVGAVSPSVFRTRLRLDQRNQVPRQATGSLSSSSGIARGSDPSMLATHINGLWHVFRARGGECQRDHHTSALFFSKKIPLRATSRRRFRSRARSGTVHGFRDTDSLFVQILMSTMCAPSGGLLGSLSCCSPATSVCSWAQSSSLASSRRAQSAMLRRADPWTNGHRTAH